MSARRTDIRLADSCLFENGKASQPAVSRILSPPFAARRRRRMTTIPLGPQLLAGSSDLPGDSDGPSVGNSDTRVPECRVTLFGLAPCGVLPATRVTTSAVRSYRTFSPLPFGSGRPRGRRSSGRCIFCATGPSGCPARELPGALPSGVRTFLPPRRAKRAAEAGGRLAGCDRQLSHVLPAKAGSHHA